MPQVFDQLTAQALDQLHRDRTVFLFAVAPVEDHGPHLPMGLDGRWAVQLAYRIALKLESECPGWTAVLMPTSPMGIETNTTRFAVRVRPHVLRDFLVDTCLSLHRVGFRHFACFSGHLGPRQLTAIEEAGLMVRRRSGAGWGWKKIFQRSSGATLVSACSPLVKRGEVFRSPFTPDPLEHGGALDTSLALAMEPSWVDANFRALPERKRQGSMLLRFWNRWRERSSGYWGAPASADGPRGEALIQEQVDVIYPKLRAVWEGSNPESLFRSLYSFLPVNRSFFPAYVLAAIIMILMFGFVFLSIEGFN